LAAYEQRVRVRDNSPLVGETLGGLGLRESTGANLIAIERSGKLLQPSTTTELGAGDILYVDLRDPNANVTDLLQKYSLQALPLTGAYFSDLSQEIGMAEVILPASSSIIGSTAADVDFRSKFGLTLIGLRRVVGAVEGELRNEYFEAGDTLLITGPWKAIRNAQGDVNEMVVFNLPAEFEEILPVQGKSLQAAACLLLVVGLMVSGAVPNVQAALIGCLLMGILGCVDLNSAYRSIDWKTIVLIVGMLPFSIALERTGGVDMAADGLMTLIGDAGPRAILASLFTITALLGMFISNTATAVLMAPIAITIAEELNASPYPFAMIVALAASTAFMTPVSSPVNTLVVTPGNYTFGDFIRVGVPFSLIVLVISIIMVPWLLPL
jgi:di/tricarboxylate transporter